MPAHSHLNQRELANKKGISIGKANYCLRALGEEIEAMPVLDGIDRLASSVGYLVLSGARRVCDQKFKQQKEGQH